MSDSDVQPLVTRCPSCHTQFRVAENQLQVAGGKVRCGACLTVFQGVDNLVWDGAEAAAADDGSGADPAGLDDLLDDLNAVEPAADTAVANDDAVPAGAEAGAGADDQAPAVDEAESGAGPEAFSVLGVRGSDTQAGEVPGADQPADEPAELSLDADEIEAPPRRTLEITLDELEAQLLADEPLRLPEADEPSSEPGAADDEERIPGENLRSVQRTTRDALTQPPAPEAATEAETVSAAAPSGVVPELAGVAGVEQEADAPAEPFAHMRSDAPREAVDPFERLAAKQRETEPALPAPGRSIWPTVGIAIGVLLLIGQVLFLRFGTWTQNPQIRPVYEAICSALPCTVPPLKALEYMEVVKKNARSHPSVENALQIDMVIANRAPFAQSFPLLEIVFTDFNNEVVAGRRFKPSEYLAGELKGQTEIPAQTPVRVQLEIEDLGDDAINYNITFR